MAGKKHPIRTTLRGKPMLIALLSTVIITLVLVFLTGLESHRSIWKNALISLSILAALIFIFLTVGLYYAVRVRDDFSGVLKLKWVNAKESLPSGMDGLDLDGGCGDEIGGVLAWILAAIVFIVVLLLLETVIWAGLVMVIAAIYWLMIRALRVIFRRSAICHGNLLKSAGYALGYTTLYIGWMYGVIYAVISFTD